MNPEEARRSTDVAPGIAAVDQRSEQVNQPIINNNPTASLPANLIGAVPPPTVIGAREIATKNGNFLSSIVLVTRDKAEDGILYVDDVNNHFLIWGINKKDTRLNNKFARPIAMLNESYYAVDRDKLFNDDKLSINIDRLCLWVDPSARNDGIDESYSQGWLTVAAEWVNCKKPKKKLTICSEMLIKTAIYAPYTLLVHALENNYYSSDTEVRGGRLVGVLSDKSQCKVLIKPDAAIMAWKACNVVATMELKPKKNSTELTTKDMGKCVLLTCLSALDLRQLFDVQSDILIPFVVGSDWAAFLYVTCLFHGSNVPEVRKVGTFFLHDQKQRVAFFATLAVLVKKAKNIFQEIDRDDMEAYFQDFDSDDYTNFYKQNPGGTGGGENGPESSTQSSSKKQKGTNVSPGGARNAALCNGSICNLEAFHIYSTRSPFYFKGDYKDDNMKQVKVFCKVWQVMEEDDTLKRYTSEKKHLKLAYELGAPCPRLLEKLCNTNVMHGEIKFHLLVMTYHRQDEVHPSDLVCYAKSLVAAVAKLHENGMLHCDIKPSNIAWNSKSKEVTILDFGLAQMQAGAKSYGGTKHYKAPEITNRAAPYSPCTDSFSVGKTLLDVCDSSCASTPAYLEDVISLLKMKIPSNRITLDQALENLQCAEADHNNYCFGSYSNDLHGNRNCDIGTSKLNRTASFSDKSSDPVEAVGIF
jgi:hypothetical protein